MAADFLRDVGDGGLIAHSISGALNVNIDKHVGKGAWTATTTTNYLGDPHIMLAS